MYVRCCINVKTVFCHDTAKANIFQKKFHKLLDHVRKVLEEIKKSRLTAHAAGILDFLEREARAGDVFVFCGTSELLQEEEIRSVGL